MASRKLLASDLTSSTLPAACILVSGTRSFAAATEAGAKLQPWPEVGKGEDIAGAALFLASDDSHFVTGHALTVDGGIMAAGPNLYGRVAGTDAAKSMVGVNRGTTGEKHSYRRLGS